MHAQVLGEHGDSEFVQWSAAQVGGRPLRLWPGWTTADEARLGSEVRRAAYEIIQRKGVTNHAIGLVTADLVRAVVRDEHRVLTVSRLQDGDPALADVALSLPAVVSRAGAGMVITPRSTRLNSRRCSTRPACCARPGPASRRRPEGGKDTRGAKGAKGAKEATGAFGQFTGSDSSSWPTRQLPT